MKYLGLVVMIAALATSAIGQNADLTMINGLPGLTGAVDIAVDGTTTLTGLGYGQTQSTSLAPGTYVIDVLDGGTIILSDSLTVAADENVSGVAHLLEDGTQALSFTVNDLSAVAKVGEGRLVVRHLAETAKFRVKATSTTSTGMWGGFSSFGSSIENGEEYSDEKAADTYDLELTQYTAPTAGGGWGGWGGGWGGTTSVILGPEMHTVTADTMAIVHVIGTEGTASFQTVLQSVNLTVATPPAACDLTVSGTLVGGSWAAGGDLTYGLTSAGANALVMVVASEDNTPQTGPFGWGLGLGIGGTGWAMPVAFGYSDATGVFTSTLTIGAGGMGYTPAGPVTFYNQAVSFDAGSWWGFSQLCLSDIEAVTVNP